MKLEKVSEEIIKLKILTPFTEEEFLPIKVFKEKASILKKSPPKTFKYSLKVDCLNNISWCETEDKINEDDFELQISRFRHFYLKSDICYFKKICNIIRNKFENNLLHQHIDEFKYNWENPFYEKHLKMEVGNTIINCKNMLDLYLYSIYVHVDISKKNKLDEIHKLIPFEFTKALFFDAVQFCIIQVLNLYSLIFELEENSEELNLKKIKYRKIE